MVVYHSFWLLHYMQLNLFTATLSGATEGKIPPLGSCFDHGRTGHLWKKLFWVEWRCYQVTTISFLLCLGLLSIYLHCVNQFHSQCKFKYEGLNLICLCLKWGFLFLHLTSNPTLISISSFNSTLVFLEVTFGRKSFIIFEYSPMVCPQPTMSSPSSLDL